MHSRMRIALTGFEAFDGDAVNPSQLLLEQVISPAGIELCTTVLPVDAEALPACLLDFLEAQSPQAVLLLGVAVQRPAMCLERVALNLLDFRIPDNAGRQLREQSIAPDGPAAYFATLPVRSWVEQLQEAGIPAQVSNTAGTYLCNQAFYLALHWAVRQPQLPRIGFLHLPALPQQSARRSSPPASMALETMLTGVQILLEGIQSE